MEKHLDCWMYQDLEYKKAVSEFKQSMLQKIWLARGGMYSRYSVLHRRKSRQWSGAQTLNTVSNEPGFLFSPELFILPVINLELHAAVLRERTIRDYKHPNVLL